MTTRKSTWSYPYRELSHAPAFVKVTSEKRLLMLTERFERLLADWETAKQLLAEVKDAKGQLASVGAHTKDGKVVHDGTTHQSEDGLLWRGHKYEMSKIALVQFLATLKGSLGGLRYAHGEVACFAKEIVIRELKAPAVMPVIIHNVALARLLCRLVRDWFRTFEGLGAQYLELNAQVCSDLFARIVEQGCIEPLPPRPVEPE